MNKKVKWILVGGGALFLTAAFIYMSWKPLAVEVVTVELTKARIWFVEDGEVAAIEDYQIYATVSGKVLEVMGAKDQYVAAGDIIAVIDSRDYQQEIDLRERTIEGYRVQQDELLKTAAAAIGQGEKELAYYRELAEKYGQLYQEGAISKLEYDTQLQSYERARSSLAAAQASKEAADYYEALIAIESLAIENLAEKIRECTIRAERSGYITALPAATISYAYPQTLLCTIKEELEMVIESYVATEDVVHIAIGDEVELIQKTRESDLVYPGTIIAIADWAEESVSALGIIERRVKVTILPLTKITTAASGYNMDVRFFTFTGTDCILLQSSAFYRFDGTDYVFAVKDGKITSVKVTKGPSSNSEAIVLEGLSEGDIILKNSTGEGIIEGARVSWR